VRVLRAPRGDLPVEDYPQRLAHLELGAFDVVREVRVEERKVAPRLVVPVAVRPAQRRTGPQLREQAFKERQTDRVIWAAGEASQRRRRRRDCAPRSQQGADDVVDPGERILGAQIGGDAARTVPEQVDGGLAAYLEGALQPLLEFASRDATARATPPTRGGHRLEQRPLG